MKIIKDVGMKVLHANVTVLFQYFSNQIYLKILLGFEFQQLTECALLPIYVSEIRVITSLEFLST